MLASVLACLLPSRWAVWSAPSAVVAYVLVTDGLAGSVIGATARLFPITSTDVVRLLVLAVGSAVHIEAAHGIERLRQVAAEGLIPYVNLKAMWTFAGAILLPPPLAVVLIATTYAHSWCRLRQVVLYRWTFSAATIVLASGTAAMVLEAISPNGYPGYPAGPLGLLAIAAAGLGYWFVNYTLVVGALMVSNPSSPSGQALGRLTDQLIVAGSLGLGGASAALLVREPWSVALLLVTVLGLHRALLANQFQTAARTDGKTGLANAVFWHEVAATEFGRAQRSNKHLSVLYIDLDHFKDVNDTVGHHAGDQVIKAVGDAIENEARTDDLVGRLGGDEFAILLPDTSGDEVMNAAERIRRRITSLIITVQTERGPATVDGLTCSLGAATYPDAGHMLDELLLAADAALYKAKAAGRDTTRRAPTGTESDVG